VLRPELEAGGGVGRHASRHNGTRVDLRGSGTGAAGHRVPSSNTTNRPPANLLAARVGGDGRGAGRR
jgi:hypothetical protein